ncbi:MAG: iron-sulfur cluster assembly scaffold protein [Planctomycetes bacterium]|nr:iron-sulfur cluster assembly scaffold protein [Planctomycetota bacterium]
MVGPRLREVMLEARFAGELEGADVRRGEAEHPVCGDRVQLSLRVAGGRILDLRWLAAGCPAAMAVTALAARVLIDSPTFSIAAVIEQAIADHGGLQPHELHAKKLVLRALAAAGVEG